MAIATLLLIAVLSVRLDAPAEERRALTPPWRISALQLFKARSLRPKGPSLFCFAVMRAEGDERVLITEQLKLETSIFGCNAYSLYSDVKVRLIVPGTSIQAETTQLPVVLHQRIGGASDKTASWLNADIFVKAWDMVIEEGEFQKHDWVVKVDPDAVFLPRRLRRRLKRYSEPLLAGVRPCFSLHSCPAAWSRGHGGGYFCRDNQGCRPGSLGPFASYCADQCYIGRPDPSPEVLAPVEAKELRNRAAPCTASNACPADWHLENGTGGYYCPQTGGCRRGDSGPFQQAECAQQCYIGEPRIVMASLPVGKMDRVYIKNCDSGFGFFGAMEIVSRSAVEEYGAKKMVCMETLDYATWGEDLFMQRCFDLLGVRYIESFDVLADGYCNQPPSPCLSHAVAFHPFKMVADYLKCLQQALQAEPQNSRHH